MSKKAEVSDEKMLEWALNELGVDKEMAIEMIKYDEDS